MTRKIITFTVFAAILGLGLAGQAEAAAIRAGFDDITAPRNDDGSTVLVSLPFTADFFGINRTALYVNTNGNVTFDAALSTYTPFSIITTSREIIAPFFADVDTRSSGSDPITYGTSTIGGRDAFGVNWVNVQHYNRGDPLNSFQLVLIDRTDTGAGNFDIEFNYDQILWEAGTASGSNSAGLGGSAARAGYSNGSTEAFELPGSAVNGAFLDGNLDTGLIHNSLNSNVLGRYVFRARNGEVISTPDPQPQPNGIVPEPASMVLMGIGMGGLALRRRKQRS